MKEALKQQQDYPQSPAMKRTSLDITTGSIDKRAWAELDEIEQINHWNVQDPKEFDKFKE